MLLISSLNLFLSSLLGAPLHAAPKTHLSYVKLLEDVAGMLLELGDSVGHLDQPKRVRMPVTVIGPVQEPPGGQSTHPGWPSLLGIQYSSLEPVQKKKW